MIEVTTPGQSEALWVIGDRIRFLGKVLGSSLELIEVEIPPGSGTPPHTHESPETFYILDGELTLRRFTAGSPPDVLRAGCGASISVPSRVPHNYINESGELVRMLVLLEPSMTAFFREIGSHEPLKGEPDFARIGAAMQRHGIEVLAAAA